MSVNAGAAVNAAGVQLEVMALPATPRPRIATSVMLISRHMVVTRLDTRDHDCGTATAVRV
ncbi:MAG: hypothetical protein GWN35_08960 [Actinobacteria bacterium]|nr:hypothetical protein [Actinomycetota bacterium]